MKGRFWRKALAAALALLIVSGSTPIQPVADVFGSIAVTASAATDGTSVFGALTDGHYTLSSQTYTLTDNVNTAGYIYVPEGVTATIDLNGHTIDRGLTSADNNGSVIIVAGTLTITDSGTGGKIQGGYDGGNKARFISGVEVQNGATFNLQGGTLIGRNQEYDSTVLVNDTGSFTMTDGKITGGWGGVDAAGNVAISGGEISGNNMYGVMLATDDFSVSGNPVITGNTQANVRVWSSWLVINVVGALTDGANIGITAPTPTNNAPVTVTSGYGTYNSEPVSTYFSLDNDGQIQTSEFDYMTVVMGWNEDRTEVAVGTALYTVNFDMNGHGDAIDAVSLLSGCKLMKPEPTADGWYFFGWYTDAACTAGNEYDFDDAVTSNMTLHALWTQEAIYSFTLPEKMVIVSTTNAPVGGKYPVGTVIKFKAAPDYVVDGDVSDGTNTLTPDGDGIYTVTMGDADITITASVKKAVEPNKTLSGSESYTANDGDVLTGSTSGTVTIANNAKITLSDVTITGGIVCEGSAEITLVGTNSVTGANNKAGIQIGGSGTTLTIKGNGSLTANGGNQSAGIGLSRAWDVDATGGDIVIEGGNITATGNGMGAGIGLGVAYDNSPRTITLGNITIKGGSVTATGGNQGKGIGTGYVYGLQNASNIGVGTITITTGIDRVEASSISESIVYMHETTDVTASKSDYFTIIENGNRRIIVQKVTPTIADVPDQTYSGSAITPEPLVLAGSLSLTKGTDYEYSYENNTDVGTATVKVTFKGDYESLGYVEKTFNITRKITIADSIEHGTVVADKVGADEGDTVTLTVTPDEGYAVGSVSVNDGTVAVTKNTDGTYSFTMPDGDVTVSAEFDEIEPVTYLDENGVEQTITDYTVLTGNEPLDQWNTIVLAGGTYVVDSELNYSNRLRFSADNTVLILKDNAKLNISADGNAIRSYNMYIYGQKDGTGELNAEANSSCIVASGNLYLYGGNITAYSENIDGIEADNIYLGGAKVNANRYKGTVQVKEGLIYGDEDGNIYTGTLTDEQIAAIAGKTLTPVKPESLASTSDEIHLDNNVSFLTVSQTYLDGYDFSGFMVGETPCADMAAVVTAVKALRESDSNAVITITPVFTQKTDEYALTIVNGHLKGSTDTSGSFKASTQLYAVADEAPNGQKFSHWEVEGKTVGYETTYAFRMPSKAMTLTAVYVADTVEVTKTGAGYIENVYKPEDGKMAFVSILSVPEGCQMLKAGIVAQKVGDFTGDLTKDNAKFVRFSDTSKNSYTSFKYTWTLTPKNADDEWTVRPYLVYTDAQGEHTVYGDAVSYSLNTIA